MAITQAPAEQRVVLHNISWDAYERILESHANHSTPRLTYDDAELEVMSPLPDQERLNHALQLLVPQVARRLGVRVYGLG